MAETALQFRGHPNTSAIANHPRFFRRFPSGPPWLITKRQSHVIVGNIYIYIYITSHQTRSYPMIAGSSRYLPSSLTFKIALEHAFLTVSQSAGVLTIPSCAVPRHGNAWPMKRLARAARLAVAGWSPFLVPICIGFNPWVRDGLII